MTDSCHTLCAMRGEGANACASNYSNTQKLAKIWKFAKPRALLVKFGQVHTLSRENFRMVQFGAYFD